MASRLSSLRGKLLPRPQPKRIEERCVLIKDPAIERWGRMRETTDQHFKFTPKTISIALFWLGLIPYGFYRLIKYDQDKRDFPKVKS